MGPFRQLCIDIETRPNPAILSDSGYWAAKMERLEPPANYKDPNKILEWRGEQVEKLRSQSALRPWLGVIVCIGIAPLDGEGHQVIVAPNADAEGEARALLELERTVDFRGVQLIGWNVRDFDVPWLIARLGMCGLAPEGFPYPREWGRVVDLKEVVTSSGLGGSLEDWFIAYGYGPKDASGPAVLELSLEELADHCRADIEVTRHIAQRTRFAWERGR